MTGGSRRCIVVSTLAEATFYADHGFDDILYAYSVPFDKARNSGRICNTLKFSSQNLVSLIILLKCPEAVFFIIDLA